MRFKIEVIIDNDRINKDKNKLIMSLLKRSLETSSKELYQKLYDDKKTLTKDFAFSMYMPNCKFERETIFIPDKKIDVYLTVYDSELGLNFYNGILANIGKGNKADGVIFKVKNINLIKEKLIVENEVWFKTMSPIVIREHNHDNDKTWYYSFDEEKGKELFLKNLKVELINKFGKEKTKDIEAIKIELITNKTVKIKHYGIEILSNICRFKMYSKPYLSEYILKAGIGSRHSQGFGMLSIL